MRTVILTVAVRDMTLWLLIPEGKRLCARHRSRWDDNIRKDLRETG
jgi:hypothetical protein